MHRSIMTLRILPVVSVLLFLGLWWALPVLFNVSSVYFPTLDAIVREFSHYEYTKIVFENLSVTALSALLGFLLSSLIAIPIGIYVGRSESASAFLSPFIEFFRPLPSVAVLPAAMLFLGLGLELKMFIVTFGTLWPVLVATIDGARSVDRLLLDTCRLQHYSTWEMFMRLYLPSAAPYIASGMRISLATSLILAVTVEMIVGPDGIGYLLIDMERSFRYPELYVGIIVLGLYGTLLNAGYVWLQRRVVFWV